MLASILSEFYERDITRLIEELTLFTHGDNLWKTQGAIKNPAGNLALHITGGLNHFIGTTLAHTSYVRDRDKEFSAKSVPREEIIKGLRDLIPLIRTTLSQVNMQAEFPIFFDKPHTSNEYVLTQLALHLNYHLGQVNYLRRILEGTSREG